MSFYKVQNLITNYLQFFKLFAVIISVKYKQSF